MKSENMVWIILMVVGGLFLLGRAAFTEHGMGKSYVKVVPAAVDTQHPEGRWKKHEPADPIDYAKAQAANPSQTEYQFSLSRTIGVWVAAFFTLFIFSFLYKDNPFYKFAEAVVIGVSAAYWMVVGFWTTIIPNLLGKLFPAWIKSWAIPDLDSHREPYWYVYFVPLLLGVLLLWRLAPKGAWIARWPLAFIIGTTAGLRMVAFIQGDFLAQIRNSIVPLIVMEPGKGFEPWDSMKNIVLVIGVLSCLVYFFFSFEHKGIVGKTARLGIWFLMITFGAAFGYTVMGRIALLAIRLEFLFDDWLWLIDPTGKRIAMLVGVLHQPIHAILG